MTSHKCPPAHGPFAGGPGSGRAQSSPHGGQASGPGAAEQSRVTPGPARPTASRQGAASAIAWPSRVSCRTRRLSARYLWRSSPRRAGWPFQLTWATLVGATGCAAVVLLLTHLRTIL